MKSLGMIAGLALLAACSTTQPEPLTIATINVSTDLSAMQSRAAVNYWKNLSPDLQSALAREFAGEIAPDGKTISVDVDELSLTSAYAPGATFKDARLSGRVDLLNPNQTLAASYDVTASSSDVVNYLPEGTTTISPTSTAYYAAVVEAFARGTAETLRNAHAAGS